MGILDEVAEDRRKCGLRGPPCGVKTILDALDGDEREDVEAAVMDAAVAAASLARVMEARGYLTADGAPVRGGTISKHRQRRCGCFR